MKKASRNNKIKLIILVKLSLLRKFLTGILEHVDAKHVCVEFECGHNKSEDYN